MCKVFQVVLSFLATFSPVSLLIHQLVWLHGSRVIGCHLNQLSVNDLYEIRGKNCNSWLSRLTWKTLHFLQNCVVGKCAHLIRASAVFPGTCLSSIHGSSNKLCQEELDRYFPDRKLRLFVGSWNMNGQTPPGEIK